MVHQDGRRYDQQLRLSVEMKSSLPRTVERGSVPLMESKYTESSIALFVLIRGAQGHSRPDDRLYLADCGRSDILAGDRSSISQQAFYFGQVRVD
jgi:hypothetical protein